MSKAPKPKRINFQLIPPGGGHESYKIMAELRTKYHTSISAAKIALAWRIGLKADVDGHLLLGKCVKASDLNREVAPYDFVILLNRQVWDDCDFDRTKKIALLDHELCHAEIVLDKKTLEPKYDERGRNLYRVRKHDIEEFKAIVERHGCYKRDLEEFAKALLKKADTPLLAGLDKPDTPERIVIPIAAKPKGGHRPSAGAND